MQKIKPPPSKQPIPSHAKRVFRGVLYDVYQWQQKMYDGTYKTFEKVKRLDTVNVIPVSKDGKIVLSEQEQPGISPFLGLPGGWIERKEDPLSAAKRELLEETGLESKEFILWDAVQPLEKTEWSIYTFIAKNCRKISEPTPDSGEKIKTKTLSIDEYINLVLSPGYRDKEIVSILLCEGVRTENNQTNLARIKKLFLN